MRIGRRFAAGCLLVLALAGVVGAATLGGSSSTGAVAPTSVSGADWQDGLQDCAKGVMTFAALNSDQVQACLEGHMRQAFESGGLDLVEEVLEAEIRRSPDLYYACHNLSHRVGAYAYSATRDAAELLRQATGGSCAYGLGHGVLDGFADAKPTDAEYAAVAQACAEIRSTPGNERVICADGLGHAAFKIAESVGGAVRLCSLLPTGEGRRECGEGVVMQVYEPAGSTPDVDAPLAPESLLSLCETWQTTDAELLAGCASGAGYIFTRPAWRLEVDWLNEHGQQEPLNQEASAKMLGLMTEASSACKALDARFHDGCLQSMAIQLPLTVQRDRGLAEQVCAQLESWSELCRSTSTQVM